MRKVVEYKHTEIAVKKKLGQNFLTDRNITRKIVIASGAGPQDNILEIGPGFGARLLFFALYGPEAPGTFPPFDGRLDTPRGPRPL